MCRRCVLIFVGFVGLALVAPTSGWALPTNFQSSTVFSGLTLPVAVRFAPDQRVFVAQKGGVILEYDSLADSTPTTVVNLATEVYNFWDRGLLGLAVDPNFPGTPYIYAMYARDAWPIGSGAPKWGPPGTADDSCPSPPGPTGNGCVVSGRLVRLQVNPATNQMVGSPKTLVDNWCQQYPSHSVGNLAFGADGALYASAGEGASFNFVDWGQKGNPVNPCGDPPGGGAGTALTPPTSEGGALRAQSFRGSGGQVPLGGSVIRIDPASGDPYAGNPAITEADINKQRIVAYGLRNPFRFAIRPGTNDLWIGDVGWGDWEEIDHVPNPTSGPTNFGWPCYEGVGRHPGYEAAGLTLCQTLYDAGTSAPPYFTYEHGQDISPGEKCTTNAGSSISGLAFYTSGPFPASYDGALFFADYSRKCIWVMFKGADGLPDPSKVQVFDDGGIGATDVQLGPNGALYYPDFDSGEIVRIDYSATNHRPTAVASATPNWGGDPLHVKFSSAGSSDPDGDPLTYAWDLDGDGLFDDSASATPPDRNYTGQNTIVRLRVTDSKGAFANSDPIVISPGNTPPTAHINDSVGVQRPPAGGRVDFAGTGADGEDPSPPALKWTLSIRHCPGGLANDDDSLCHTHPPIGSWTGPSAWFSAPEHEFPSYYRLQLTATDSRGLTDTQTVKIIPSTVNLTVQSNPPGRTVALNSLSGPAPVTTTVMANSSNSVSAPSPQINGPDIFDFHDWSDGGGQSHNVVAGFADTTVVASFLQRPRNAGTLLVPAPAGTPLSPLVRDSRPPVVRTSVPSPQWPLRSGSIRAWVTCPYEVCRVSARTTLTPPGRGARSVLLVTTLRRLGKGRRSLFVLRLSDAARRALVARLRRHRQLSLAVIVRASDLAGNSSVRVTTIHIRR